MKIHRVLHFLAVRTGLEPATLGVTGRYSNQLNYRTIKTSAAKLSEFLLIQNKYVEKYPFYASTCHTFGSQPFAYSLPHSFDALLSPFICPVSVSISSVCPTLCAIFPNCIHKVLL